ncbi:MAG: PAS domain S-box-containing protein [Myxococcota bacterium]|jgi:PAS domain S-box-containing protein
MNDFSALLEETAPSIRVVWRPGSPPVVAHVSNGAARLGIGAHLCERGTPLELADPKQATARQAILDAAIEAQEPGVVLDDYQLTGRTLWLSHIVHLRYTPAGELLWIVDTLQDVTARKHRELAMQAQQTRLELVLEGTRLGMWDWNLQTNAVTFDARWAEMLGNGIDEIPDELEAWTSRVHPDDLEGCYDDLGKHMRGEVDFYQNVHRMRHRDGSWRHILDRGCIMERDASGTPVRFTGTHTDITAQKEAELRAQAATEAKSHFLAMMSHEIRTPLHGILGLLEIIQSSQPREEQAALLRVIQNSSDMLLVIINDILDTSKIEQGQLKIDPHDFSLPELLDMVQQTYQQHADSKSLLLRLHIDPTVPEQLFGDSYRIRQIMVNLVSNALKFTDTGTVTLRASAEPLEPGHLTLSLSVADTGTGITDTQRIWERFSQEHASTARRHGGTGLGLSICQSLTHLMGGEITLESTPDIGSTFRVTLPLETSHSPSAEEEPTAQLILPLRVLVVDDHPVNQLILAHILTDQGLEHRVAGSGREALELVATEHFDVVLMDLHMPDVTGIEATRQIRDLPIPQPHIIGLSADAFEETASQCVDAGMDSFISKPFKKTELLLELSEVPAVA